MEILCACPFSVGTLGWEPGPGRRALSVCVKATFTLVRGGAAILAPLQDPFRADDAAPDLVPLKPRADVLFTGHIHAPGGAPAESLIARARVGALQKSLSVNGDRSWVPSFEGLRPSPAIPFRRMPLTYERAVRTGENLGGVDISQGADPQRPLANIAAIAGQGGETPGLGPLPLLWRARRLGLGDAATFWASRAGIEQGPPPQGFDFRVFNAAPVEQQLDELSPGTDILLENLHPEHALLATRLPSVRVKLFRRPPGSDASDEVAVRCDTLWIDTDRGLAITLWRGTVLLDGEGDDDVGTLVVTAEADGERIVAAEVDRMLARFAPDPLYVDPGAVRGELFAGAGPTIGDPIPVPAAPPPPTGPVDEPTPLPEARRPPTTPLVPPPSERSTVQPLPFRASGSDLDGASPTSGQEPDDAEMTPPRGYPTVSDVRALPPLRPSAPGFAAPPMPPRSPTPALGRFGTLRPERPASPPVTATIRPPAPQPLDAYAAAKMDGWRSGRPLGEVLARHGIDEVAFRAHEAAQLEALGDEAAGGRSDLAIALLESLAGAEQGR